MTYGMDTCLELNPSLFACGYAAGRAICSDGVVRSVRFTDGIPDTFFSITARVSVRGKTVSGYVTTETAEGWSTGTDGDPTVVKFVANDYGRNAAMLPRGVWKREALT